MRHDEAGSFDETLTKYKHALEKLASFRIRISGASRLRGYQRRIETFLKQPGVCQVQPDTETLSEVPVPQLTPCVFVFGMSRDALLPELFE